MQSRFSSVLVLVAALACMAPTSGATSPQSRYDLLEAAFADPPARARPDAFWAWLNGHADPGRISYEMEQFRTAGFSRLQVWDVKAHRDPEGVVPVGPPFLGDEWLGNLAHADREARRLGLELGLVAASGWNAGGPWVAPERAGLGVYVSVTAVEGPGPLDVQLTRPTVPEHSPRDAAGRPSYGATIAVQASPARDGVEFDPEGLVDVTPYVDGEGRLRWDAPPGRWTVRWFLRANSGQRLIVPSPRSDGLQIDFFDPRDTRAYFEHVLDRLEAGLGPLSDSSLRYLEVDSLELEGSRLHAWTEDVLAQFAARYGYDAAPWLTLLVEPHRAGASGRRFLHDWSRLVSDLMIEHHYRLGSRLLEERGLRLSAEAGGPGPPIWNSCPVDAIGALGATASMRGEFWPKQRSMYNVKGIACAAHTYGRRIVDAESFTSWRHWRDLPYYLKLLADQAFVDGLNHVTFHTAPHGGAGEGLPGFAYHAGTHVGPNVVWWPMARPFIDYLSRCCTLLQEGLPVADVCFYQGDGAPVFHPLGVDWDPAVRPAGYDYDVVDVRLLVEAMTVADGRLHLPGGASYALLVLPDEAAIDLAALRKVRQLVHDGATVLGPRPSRSAGLAGYPGSDAEVMSIADEVWGDLDASTVGERAFGAGRVLVGTGVVEALGDLAPDFAFEGDGRTRLSFVHRRAPHAEIYFVVNDHERWERVLASFRVDGRAPEVWDPATGTIRAVRRYEDDGGRTRLELELPPGGSTFIVFRDRADAERPLPLAATPLRRAARTALDVTHGDTPNGPAWVSSGARAPSNEFIEFDLGGVRDLVAAEIWNYQDQTRGLLTRGVREVQISARVGGGLRSLGPVELRKAPSIGERGYQQRIPLDVPGATHVRFDVVSNHSDDWNGHTRVVGLGRVRFLNADGATIPDVTVSATSSGVAHDPVLDALRAVRPQGIEVAGPWRLRFPLPGREPIEFESAPLASWTESEVEAVRHFSGIATYETSFDLDLARGADGDLARGADGDRVVLDLGRVAGVARVFLNGEDLGVVWKPPYAVDVSGPLRDGPNLVRCEVANTWHNRLVGDARLPPAERSTRTNIRGPFQPETPLLESGLLGPVRLVRE